MVISFLRVHLDQCVEIIDRIRERTDAVMIKSKARVVDPIGLGAPVIAVPHTIFVARSVTRSTSHVLLITISHNNNNNNNSDDPLQNIISSSLCLSARPPLTNQPLQLPHSFVPTFFSPLYADYQIRFLGTLLVSDPTFLLLVVLSLKLRDEIK